MNEIYSDEIRERIEGFKNKKFGPLFLEIYPSSRCNLNCIYCELHPEGTLNQNFPEDSFEKLFVEASEMGLKSVSLSGIGEPMLNPSLILRIASIARKKGIKTSMVTNGTLFNESFTKKLMGYGWDEIILSVDSPKKATLNTLRGRPYTYDKIVNSLKLINKYRKSFDSTSLNFHSVITNKNIGDLADLFLFAQKNQVSKITFDSLVTYSEKMKTLALSKNDEERLNLETSKMKNLVDQTGVLTNLFSFVQENPIRRTATLSDKPAQIPPCLVPWFRMVIFPGGDARPCCNFYEPVDSFIGKSFSEVWFGKKMMELRERLLGATKFPCCNVCPSGLLIQSKTCSDAFSGDLTPFHKALENK